MNSTKKALENYYKKQIKKLEREQKPKRFNNQPEKEVQKECVQLLTALGFEGQVYSAKAVYNPRAGRYISQTMAPGTCDWQGATPEGTFAAVEFKAPGALKKFNIPKNHRQKDYIIKKIEHNCFACVVDSAELLRQIYDGYCQTLLISKEAARLFLLKNLP